MSIQQNKKRRGYSLTELAIVLGVMGAVIGAIWVAVGLESQSAKVEQSAEDISLIVDSTRVAYAGQAAIYGGVASVVPQLVNMGSMPSHTLNSVPSTCSGVTSYYAHTKWGGTSACGTLGVCGWPVGIAAATAPTNQCSPAASNTAAQYLAVEFTKLDYRSCVALATRPTTTFPIVGLNDVYVNTVSIMALSGSLPVTPAQAEGACINGGATNVIDFVYSLRPPAS